jgi:hypothetical protein
VALRGTRTQWHSVALSGTQWHSVALSGTRRSGAGQAAPTGSIQGTQGSSEVIRGHPRPSESLMGHPEATLPVAAGRAQGAFDGASRARRSEAPYGSVARASPERACPLPPTHPPRRSVARGPRGASLPVGRERRGEPLHARRAQLYSRVSPRELAFSAACASILAIATGLPSFRKALAARVYSPARLRHEAA